MTEQFIYRGYDIDHDVPDRWVVSRNHRQVHVAKSHEEARAWVDAERKRELERERNAKGGDA